MDDQWASCDVGDRVSVLWAESGVRYNAVVQSKTDDGYINVLYEDTVKGKLCYENNVALARVFILHNDQSVEISEGSSSNSQDINVLNRIAEKLRTETFNLSFEEISQLHQWLGPRQICQLVKNPELNVFVAHQLSESLMNDNLDLNFLDTLATSTSASTPRKNRDPPADSSTSSSSSRPALEAAAAAVASGCVLIRMLVLSPQPASAPESNFSISLEHVERVVAVAQRFLTENNFTAFQSKQGVPIDSKETLKNEVKVGKRKKSKAGTDEGDDECDDEMSDGDAEGPTLHERMKGRTKSKGPKARGKSTNTFMDEVGRTLSPLILSLMLSLETLFLAQKQGDRLCMSVYEFSVLLLRLDPATNAQSDFLDRGPFLAAQKLQSPRSHSQTPAQALASTLNSPLLKLHKSAVTLLRLIFQQYPSHRRGILQELLPLFAQVYSARHPTRSYQLDPMGSTSSSGPLGSSGGGGGRVRRTQCSTAFAALVTVLQSSASAGAGEALPSFTASTSASTASAPVPSNAQNVTFADSVGKAAITKSGVGEKNSEVAVSKIRSPRAAAAAAAVATRALAQAAEKKDVDEEQMGEPSPPKSGPLVVVGGQLEAWLLSCRRLCALFIGDLLKRCSHKDMTSEYRVVVTQLVEECITCLPCLHFPVVAVFLEQLVRRVLQDVASAIDPKSGAFAGSGAGSGTDAKRDPSYLTLCMDVLGTIGASIREMIVEIDKNATACAGVELSTAVRGALKSKVAKLSTQWVQDVERLSASVALRLDEPKKGGKRGQREVLDVGDDEGPVVVTLALAEAKKAAKRSPRGGSGVASTATATADEKTTKAAGRGKKGQAVKVTATGAGVGEAGDVSITPSSKRGDGDRKRESVLHSKALRICTEVTAMALHSLVVGDYEVNPQDTQSRQQKLQAQHAMPNPRVHSLAVTTSSRDATEMRLPTVGNILKQIDAPSELLSLIPAIEAADQGNYSYTEYLRRVAPAVVPALGPGPLAAVTGSTPLSPTPLSLALPPPLARSPLRDRSTPGGQNNDPASGHPHNIPVSVMSPSGAPKSPRKSPSMSPKPLAQRGSISHLGDEFGMGDAAVGASASEQLHLIDAHYLALALWHKDCVAQRRLATEDFVLALTEEKLKAHSSAGSTGGAGVVLFPLGGAAIGGGSGRAGAFSPSVRTPFTPSNVLSSLVAPLASRTTATPSTSFGHTFDDDMWRTFFSYDWNKAIYCELLVGSFLRDVFEKVLACLLMLFTASAPGVRARVIKTLAVLVNADPDLISRPEVRQAITERFNDVAISVREEVVKLVGSYVVKGYDLSREYLDGLVVRLRDKGVSVRKAVVANIRDILLYEPSHPRYSELCLHLLERGALPKEEDTIRDTIRSTFQTVWFLPPSTNAVTVAMKPRKHLAKVKAEKDEDERDPDRDEKAEDHADAIGLPSGDLAFLLPCGWTSTCAGQRKISKELMDEMDSKSKGIVGDDVDEVDKDASSDVVSGSAGSVAETASGRSSPRFSSRSSSRASSPRGRLTSTGSDVPAEAKGDEDDDKAGAFEYMSPHGHTFYSFEEALKAIGLPSRPVDLARAICSAKSDDFDFDFDTSASEWAQGIIAEVDAAQAATAAAPQVAAPPGRTEMETEMPESGNVAPNQSAVDPDQGLVPRGRKSFLVAAAAHTDATVAQIIDVIATTDNNDWMVSLLREMLHGASLDGDEAQKQQKQRRQASVAHCEALVSCLVEMLLRTEERDERLLASIKGKRDEREHLVAVMVTLSMFCEAHPPFVVPHLSTLLPYLKGHGFLTAKQEGTVALKVADMLSAATLVQGASLGTSE